MRPYQFRLETVRRLRQSQRDDLRGQLADGYLAAEKIADEIQRIEAEITSERAKQTQSVAASHLNVNQLLDSQRYEVVLRSQQADLQKKAKLVEEEIERRRQAVVVAEREVKVLDTLDDRQRERSKTEANREEQKLSDEMAGILRDRQDRPARYAEGGS